MLHPKFQLIYLIHGTETMKILWKNFLSLKGLLKILDLVDMKFPILLEQVRHLSITWSIEIWNLIYDYDFPLPRFLAINVELIQLISRSILKESELMKKKSTC